MRNHAMAGGRLMRTWRHGSTVLGLFMIADVVTSRGRLVAEEHPRRFKLAGVGPLVPTSVAGVAEPPKKKMGHRVTWALPWYIEHA